MTCTLECRLQYCSTNGVTVVEDRNCIEEPRCNHDDATTMCRHEWIFATPAVSAE